jgi:hypothetical protein
VDLRAVFAEGPSKALDLGGDWWGLDFREEGRVEFCCGGVPFFDCLSRSGLDPCVSIGGEADAIPRRAGAYGFDLDDVRLAAGAVVGEDDVRSNAPHMLHGVVNFGCR